MFFFGVFFFVGTNTTQPNKKRFQLFSTNMAIHTYIFAHTHFSTIASIKVRLHGNPLQQQQSYHQMSYHSYYLELLVHWKTSRSDANEWNVYM